MPFCSTRATGNHVARKSSILSWSLAVTVTALAAGCGGGGSTGGDLPAGATVNAQATQAPAPSPVGLVADPAAVLPAGPQPSVLAVGGLSAGGHAIAWWSAADGAIHVQGFDAAGQPAGAPLQIAVDSALGAPAVALRADGSVIVATVAGGAASPDTPWITRTAISVQRFDASGAPAGAAVQLGAVEQNRIGAATMRYVAEPALAVWDDGSFVVAWSQVEEDSTGRFPQFFGQRFDASGQPAGGVASAGAGERDTSFQLVAAPSGGWVVTTFHRTFGRTFQRFHAFDGAAAPELPPQAIGVAEGSVFVPLYSGRSVLLAPTHVYGSLQMYGPDGQALGMAGALAAPPTAAVPLRDGGFVTFTVNEGQLLAQRFDAAGHTSGDSVAVAAGTAPLRGSALAGGGVAIGWATPGEVAVQRLR